MQQPSASFEPFRVADAARSDTAQKRLVLINDTRPDLHHGCEIAVAAIQHLAAQHGMIFTAAAPMQTDYTQDAAFMAEFAAADGIVVNGEGSIHHDKPAAKWLLQAGERAKAQGKPSLLFNTTWAHNGPAFVDLARAFDLISVRESSSQAELAQSDVTTTIAPDAALFFDWPTAEKRSGITVTDSVLTDATRQLTRFARQHNADMINIRFPDTSLSSRIADFRRMVDRDAPFNLSNLRDALSAASHGFGATDRSTPNFLHKIASSQLVITGRFHAVILALATRTPFLAVASNTHKIEATLRDAGLADWRIVTPETLTPERIKAASTWQGEEAANIERFIAHGRTAQSNAFANLRQLIT